MKNKMTEKIKYLFAFSFYILRSIFEPSKVYIKNIDETIDDLVNSNKSMVRFGDGEIAIIRGFDIRFQKQSEQLSRELVDTMCKNDLMVAIPDVLYTHSIKQYKRKDREAWIYESMFSYPIYRKYCCKRTLYNSLVSRLYLPYGCKYEVTFERFERIKKLWLGKKVLIVEGKFSRFGVGNDLLSKTKLVHRILCPAKNAFDSIETIEQTIIIAHKSERYDLIILALGPTAKVLVNHLYPIGRFVDLGHLDIEYEWFLRKAENKTNIPGKAVNEVPDGYRYIENYDKRYQSEIIACIEDTEKI